MSRRGQAGFDSSQLRITRGALILLFLVGGISMVYQLSPPATRAAMEQWLVPTSLSVWREWKLWTLATGPLLETSFVSLIFQGLVLWLFMPALERWWSTPRFLRFAVYTSLAGTVAGTLFGLAAGRVVPIVGISPFIYAGTVAFGLLYARQPVQFFGVLPLTGRQMMFGILAFMAVFVVLNGAWDQGVSYAAAIGVALALSSQRWNPRAAWLRWRGQRMRRHLEVLDGGKPGGKRGGDKKWVN